MLHLTGWSKITKSFEKLIMLQKVQDCQIHSVWDLTVVIIEKKNPCAPIYKAFNRHMRILVCWWWILANDDDDDEDHGTSNNFSSLLQFIEFTCIIPDSTVH